MISVIVPMYNSEKTIGNTVKALLKQNYPKSKYEIILVDDGSTDKTVDIVSKFPVKVIKLKHKGPAYARNTGVKKSRGDIILFTDADCIPDKNWIKNMVKPFKEKKLAGVSGTYKTLNKDNLLARFIGYDIQYRHERMKKIKSIDFVGTFSAGYRKSIFLREKGFNTSFPIASGEDPELSYRIAKKHRIVFQPTAFVFHPHPEKLKDFLKQKFWRVFWRFLMYRKHKKKILGDSYTPLSSLASIWFQILSVSIICLLLLLSFFISFSISYGILILALILTIFIFNIRFSLWIWKYDKTIALISPIFYFLRNIAFILGIVFGSINLLLQKFCKIKEVQ